MTTLRSARAVLLLLMCSCQTPPAELSGCTPRSANSGRSRVLMRQILCDTGEEIVHHPLRAGRIVFADQVAWFGSVSRGIFGKRLSMRSHGAPSHLCFCEDCPNPDLIETDLQPASVQLYRDGHAALAALEQRIDSTQCRIDVLMYI
jgi:hypothetical protein